MRPDGPRRPAYSSRQLETAASRPHGDRPGGTLPDVAHTFRRGHRVMVQIQSSWFPLTDRNPQTFTDIPKARPQDFVAATQRIYRSLARASSITLPVEAPVRTP